MLRIVSPRRPRTALALALATACAAGATAGAATAAPAPTAHSAAAAMGTVNVLVGGNGKTARALRRQRVQVRAIKPARGRGASLTLPAADIAVAKAAKLKLRGGIRFRKGRRVVAARALRLRLAARRLTVSARVGKGRLPLFAASVARGEAKLNAIGAATLDSARLRLTARAARLLRKRLGVGRLPAGPLGVVSLDVIDRSLPSGGGRGVAGCDPNPKGRPTNPAGEPAPPGAPAGATAVTNLALVWRPKESWIRYINGGEGVCVYDAAVGAAKEVRPGTATPLVYAYHLPPAEGWHHGGGTADPADDVARLTFGGGLGFKWAAHGINFAVADPEIEISGGGSRAIFRVRRGGDQPLNERQTLLSLVWPVTDSDPSPNGYRFTIPAAIPVGVGGSLFSGFYSAGQEFGTVTVSFTVPTP